MNRTNGVPLITLIIMIGSLPLSGEVRDSGSAGFTVAQKVEIAASPMQVYSKFVRVADWWHPDHTFSGNSRFLSLDARPNGCFCEIWVEGTGVRHMTVVYADPGKLLRMTGALGPLQGLAATGTMTLTFAASEGGTSLELTYQVAGYKPGGLAGMAEPVDTVLGEQVARLKRYIETGKPD